jgi:hypothetical protein
VAAIVGSSIFDGGFTAAVRSFHGALTDPNSKSAVLALADFGATATTALERFLPQAAGVIQPQLNLRLAEVGGQGGVAAVVIPAIQAIKVAAWVLLILAVVLFALGVWVSPNRRLGFVRTGWILVGVGALQGLLAVFMYAGSAVLGGDTLARALTSAAMVQLANPLVTRVIATVIIGGLMVSAAGALFPQLKPHEILLRTRDWALWRPTRPSLAVLRSLLLVAAGLGMILYPTVTADLLAITAGLMVFFWGVAELDRVAEHYLALDRARAAELAAADGPPPRRRQRRGWLIPAGAGAVALVLLAAMFVPAAMPQRAVKLAAIDDAHGCNGHVELCDRPFDQVALPASHNSMSAADEPGWFLAEQPTGIVKSLDDGIRALLVDTWYGQGTPSGAAITADKSMAAAEAELKATFGAEVVASVRRSIDRIRREKGVGPVEPYFCHTVCEIGATRMLPVLQGIRKWMDDHPREVLVIFIQDSVTPADTAAVFKQAGLADLAYTHEVGSAWPTLGQMIDSRKRLVVLMENTGGGTAYPWLMQGFDQVQDTPYTFNSVADFNCTRKRGTEASQLFAINHWLASFTHLVTNAEKVNAYPVLSKRVKQCWAERDMVPNLVAVNWYDRGDLFRVVDEVNGVD